MPVSDKDARLLFQKSGNRCAFPECGKLLTYVDQEVDAENEVAVSDIAHIVAEKADGPRGRYPLPLDDRNKVGNLILLCKEHHRVIDEIVATYPVRAAQGDQGRA